MISNVQIISCDKKTIDIIKSFIDTVVEDFKLNVVGECSHQVGKFNVPHADTIIHLLPENDLSIHDTIIYLLPENDLSIHTLVDDGGKKN